MIKIFSQVISEVFLICLYPFSALVINFLPKSSFDFQGKGQKILIVERWMSPNVRHLYWKYYLEKKGFSVALINFSLWKGNFDQSAKKLKQYLEDNDLKNIVLVGISSGALTSLMYLQEENGWERVNKFVAVGAPFEGTWAAMFLLFVRSGWELLPESKFISRIKAYQIKNTNNILSIRAKFDEMVPFGTALRVGHIETVNIIGHNNLHIRVSATYRKIIEFASK